MSAINPGDDAREGAHEARYEEFLDHIFYATAVHVGHEKGVRNGVVYESYEDAEASAKDPHSRWMLCTGWEIVEVTGAEVEKKKLSIYKKPVIKGAGHRVQL